MNEQLESIKTYLLVAFIFSILALVPWALALIFWSVIPLVGIIVASIAATPTPFEWDRQCLFGGCHYLRRCSG